MIPTFGLNPVDPSLVYAWPTRRVMAAADCPVHAGVFLDPDAVDPADPGLDAAILASLEGEPAATAKPPEVVDAVDPAGGTDAEAVQDAILGDSGAKPDEDAAGAVQGLESRHDGRGRDHGRHGR